MAFAMTERQFDIAFWTLTVICLGSAIISIAFGVLRLILLTI